MGMAGKSKAGDTGGEAPSPVKVAKVRKAGAAKPAPEAAAGKPKRKPRAPVVMPSWHPNWQEEFLRRIESGRSARSVCLDPDIPDGTTVWARLEADGEFAKQYARACEARADALFEEIFDIADDGSNDWMGRNDPEIPGYDFNGEHVQRSKLRIDTRKWAVGKLAPKKYGEKLAVEATVQVGDIPEEERLAKLVAQIPVLNTMFAKVGYVIVKTE